MWANPCSAYARVLADGHSAPCCSVQGSESPRGLERCCEVKLPFVMGGRSLGLSEGPMGQSWAGNVGLSRSGCSLGGVFRPGGVCDHGTVSSFFRKQERGTLLAQVWAGICPPGLPPAQPPCLPQPPLSNSTRAARWPLFCSRWLFRGPGSRSADGG